MVITPPVNDAHRDLRGQVGLALVVEVQHIGRCEVLPLARALLLILNDTIRSAQSGNGRTGIKCVPRSVHHLLVGFIMQLCPVEHIVAVLRTDRCCVSIRSDLGNIHPFCTVRGKQRVGDVNGCVTAVSDIHLLVGGPQITGHTAQTLGIGDSNGGFF